VNASVGDTFEEGEPRPARMVCFMKAFSESVGTCSVTRGVRIMHVCVCHVHVLGCKSTLNRHTAVLL